MAAASAFNDEEEADYLQASISGMEYEPHMLRFGCHFFSCCLTSLFDLTKEGEFSTYAMELWQLSLIHFAKKKNRETEC